MSEHALNYATRTVNGAEVKFGKITARDRAAVLQRLKAARKDVKRGHLKETGLPPDQAYVELEKFEDKKYGEVEWIEYLTTPEGASEVLGIAYAKHQQGDATPAVAAAEERDGGLVPLLCEVCNLKPLAPKPEGDGPNPPTPATTPGESPNAGKTYGT